MKNKNKINKTSLSKGQIVVMTLLAASAINMMPEASFAAGSGVTDVFSNTMCGIAGWFTSGTGKAIATIAVIFLGIAAFFGKVTWGLALMFAVGIFAIFGASEIVDAVSDNRAGSGCSTSSGS